MRNKVLLLLLALAAFSCVKPYPEEEIVVALPEPSYTINGEAIGDVVAIKVDSTLLFKAEITNTNKFTCAWMLDGVKMAVTQAFTYKFEDPGEYTVRFEAENEKGSCEKDILVSVAGVPLEVEYSITDETIETLIGQSVKVSVNVLSGDKQTTHSWRLGEQEISTSTSVSWTPSSPGEYTLSHFAINRDKNTASRAWTIVARDLPLSGTFTPKESDIVSVVDAPITFKANITAGIYGLTHSWSIDGAAQSETTDTFTWTFTQAGSYTVGYKAVNAQKDELEHSWNITIEEVTPGPGPEEGVVVFDDFEASSGMSSYYIGNAAGSVNNVVSVVDNPYRTPVNASAKVLIDEGSLMNWTSSAYFKFKIKTFPDGTDFPASERAKYDRLRVKVYLGDKADTFTPLLQEDAKSTRSLPVSINGIDFDPANLTMDAWNAAIKKNEWNVLIYSLKSSKFSSEINTFADVEQIQFRPCVDFKNNGQTPADVYFDDIEFLPKDEN